MLALAVARPPDRNQMNGIPLMSITRPARNPWSGLVAIGASTPWRGGLRDAAAPLGSCTRNSTTLPLPPGEGATSSTLNGPTPSASGSFQA